MVQIIGVNPNSYSSIKKVLCNFISVSDECAWVREGFDDVPYRTAEELIENTVKCLECGDIIDLKEESFEEHLNKLHHGEVNIQSQTLFLT